MVYYVISMNKDIQLCLNTKVSYHLFVEFKKHAQLISFFRISRWILLIEHLSFACMCVTSTL